MRRTGCSVLMLLALSACMSGPPVRSVALAGGAVVAQAPDGYCVDPTASRPGDGFAIMAPCATLGHAEAPPPLVGVATVQVGDANSRAVTGAEQDWRRMLESDSGAALLSKNGQGDTVTVLGAQAQPNNVKVYFADTAPRPMPNVQAQEWRAFLDLNGRLVTVGVRGLASAPLTDGTGGWLLDMMVKGLVDMAAPPGPEA